ncbi:hypothetical protein [Brevundimonas sp.]
MIADLAFVWALAAQPAVQTAPSPAGSQNRFWEERLVRAGFPALQPRGEFRRVMLSDPYMMLPVPGLELRRRASGEVDLVLQYPEWRSDPIAVDPALWDAVPAETLFAPPPRRPARSTPPAICHGWSAVIQDDTGRLANWHACADEATPVAEFAERLVTAAVATRPDCAADPASPFFAFQHCFGLKPELEDPALEAAFAPLRREWDAVPGSDALGAARRALQTPDLRYGNAIWRNARRAVEAVKATQDQRRDLSQRLARLSFEARTASPADRYRISRTLGHWSDFTAGQDQNYASLLEQLLAVEP